MIQPRLQPLAVVVAVLLLVFLLAPVQANTLVATNNVVSPPTAAMAGVPGTVFLTLYLRNGTNIEDLSSTRLTWTVTRTTDGWPMFVTTGTVFAASNGAVRFSASLSTAGSYAGTVTATPTGLASYVAGRQTITITNSAGVTVTATNAVTINAATNSIAVTNVVTVTNSFNITGITVTNSFAPTNIISVTVTTGVQAVNGSNGIVTLTPGNIGALSNLVTVGSVTGAISASTLYLTNFNEAASFVNGSNTYFEGRMTTQLFTNSTTTAIFMTNNVDSGGNWNNTLRVYTVPTAGVYAVSCYLGANLLNAATPYILSLTAGQSGSTNTVVQFRNNTVNASTDVSVPLSMAAIRMSSGDTFQFLFFQQSGGTRTNSAWRSNIYRVGD